MNDEMEKAERLFQQLSGSETTKKEYLGHLKVCFQGDLEYGDKIIQELLGLDSRVKNSGYYGANLVNAYYFVNPDTFNIEYRYTILEGYKLLDIEDYLDEEEYLDGPEPYYCPMCEEEIDSFNETVYYSDGDECCQSCYDESCDDLEDADDEECEQSYTPQVSDLESSELMYRQLSETNSNPKEIINSKLSELSSLSRRRRR